MFLVLKKHVQSTRQSENQCVVSCFPDHVFWYGDNSCPKLQKCVDLMRYFFYAYLDFNLLSNNIFISMRKHLLGMLL